MITLGRSNPIEQVRTAVEQTARTIFPNVVTFAAIWPLLDLSLGDVCTDVCMRLAAELKRSPDEIGTKILAALPSQLPASCSLQHGFINIRLHDEYICRLNSSSYFESNRDRPHLTRINTPCTGFLGYPYLRLFSLALLQFVVLRTAGRPAQFQTVPTGIECTECSDPTTLMLNAIELSGQACSGSVKDLLQKLCHSIPGSECGHITTAWLPPEALSSGQVSSFLKNRPEQQHLIKFRSPSHNWLYGLEDAPALKDLANWCKHEILALLIYLAQPIPASQLDLLVPRSKESANLCWLLQSVYERLQRIPYASPAEASAALDPSPALSTIERTLLLRFKLFDAFCWQAAYQGEVSNLVAVLTDLLRTSVRYINGPGLSHRLHQARQSTQEAWIVTHLQVLLSTHPLLKLLRTGCEG